MLFCLLTSFLWHTILAYPSNRVVLFADQETTSKIIHIPDDGAVSFDATLASQLSTGTYPSIDGHNDFPMSIGYESSISLNDRDIVSLNSSEFRTDLTRLRKGHVGAQFWSAYIPCRPNYTIAGNELYKTMRQIDVIHRMVEKYPEYLQFAYTADDISHAIANGKTASLIGIEGGHQIDGSLAALRLFYQLGVRYMTLTHTCHTAWADSAARPPIHNGLTDFGGQVVKEMNRLGMLVDISHVSHKVMRDVVQITKSPLFFSHSSVYSLCKTDRNAPDDVLLAMNDLDGIIMINFWPALITCNSTASIDDVVTHIEYVAKLVGPQHVGFGSDFDGIPSVPTGLEDVTTFPRLIDALRATGTFTEEDLAGIAYKNLLRVLKKTEQVAKSLPDLLPIDAEFPATGRSN